MRVAIAFADLAGYTRLTEEEGELEAVDAVERFVEAVETTLPDDARVIKTIGDEVMIVGSDPAALTDWAVGFQQLQSEPPLPRIGIHYGDALYRDGDYYGRDVNIASRVAARSAGGEVLVTRPVVERARLAPRVRADRRGAAEGLQRVDRDLPRAASGARSERARARRRGAARAACWLPGGPVVVLLSGGRDSTCLLDVAVRIAGPAAVGRAARQLRAARRGGGRRAPLRRAVRAARRGARGQAPAAAAGQSATCRRGRATSATGPPPSWRPASGADVAAGHTATDQVETILYRLASSPSRRALLGMRAREGRLVRPLLRFTREQTAAYCVERGLSWREDETNSSDAYARGRVRGGLVPALRGGPPGAEANVLALAEVLRDEARGAGRAGRRGARRGATRSSWHACGRCRRRSRRLVVQRLADGAAGGPAPGVARRADEVAALPSTAPRCSICRAACGRWPSGECCASCDARAPPGAARDRHSP